MREIDTCIVGATGLVGQTMLKVLEEYDFPVGRLKLLASKRSAGKVCVFKGKKHTVQELTETSFEGYDLALFSAGASVSKEFAPIARSQGLFVIDNSSAWREDSDIPLIVPEVNLEDYTLNRLIANPNCSTIQAVLPLKALQRSLWNPTSQLFDLSSSFWFWTERHPKIFTARKMTRNQLCILIILVKR